MSSTTCSEDTDSHGQYDSAGEVGQTRLRKASAKSIAAAISDAAIDCDPDDLDGETDGPKAIYRGKLKSQYKGGEEPHFLRNNYIHLLISITNPLISPF
jgi:hypothetical protein